MPPRVVAGLRRTRRLAGVEETGSSRMLHGVRIDGKRLVGPAAGEIAQRAARAPLAAHAACRQTADREAHGERRWRATATAAAAAPVTWWTAWSPTPSVASPRPRRRRMRSYSGALSAARVTRLPSAADFRPRTIETAAQTETAALARWRQPRLSALGVHPAVEQQLDPRKAALTKVRPHHRLERPLLEVRALECGVENDPASPTYDPRAEVDVLDRRQRIALAIEPARGVERVGAHGPEPGPEGGCRPGGLLVDVVMEEISKAGDGTGRSRAVVVGAEHRCQLGVVVEGAPDTRKGIRVREDVGIDEHEDVSRRVACPGVARACRATTLRHHDHLLRRQLGSVDRLEARRERPRVVGGGDDGSQARHGGNVPARCRRS